MCLGDLLAAFLGAVILTLVLSVAFWLVVG